MAVEIERSQSVNLGPKKSYTEKERSSSYPIELRVVENSFSVSDFTMPLKNAPNVYMMTEVVGEEHVPYKNDIRAPKVVKTLAAKKKGIKFRKMYLAALAALLSAVAMGMATAYSAPATYDMEKRSSSRVRINPDESTWIGSLVALGALTGGLFAGPLADKLGRKEALIYNSVPFLTGWLLIAYAPTVFVIFVGRFISGMACGVISVTVPMYTVEISTPGVRGLLGASYQGLLVVGSLITMTIGAYVVWTWLAVASAIMVVIALVCLCPMPESPRWLIAHGRWDEAIAAVEFFQGDHLDAHDECTRIMEDIKMQPKGKLTIKDFLLPTVYKPALLSAAQMFFQQFSGANAVLYYTPHIIESSGSTLDPKISAIAVSSIQVVATLVSTALMDKAGRRVLLLLSGFFMAISMISLATFSFFDYRDATLKQTMGWIPLVSILVFITAFSFGYGSIPWLMAVEMVPVRARSTISGMATFFNGLFVFAVTKTFKLLEEIIKPYGLYWTFGGISFLGCIFMWLFLPETKGRRLEDIQKIFLRAKKNSEVRTISSITLREDV